MLTFLTCRCYFVNFCYLFCVVILSIFVTSFFYLFCEIISQILLLVVLWCYFVHFWYMSYDVKTCVTCSMTVFCQILLLVLWYYFVNFWFLFCDGAFDLFMFYHMLYILCQCLEFILWCICCWVNFITCLVMFKWCIASFISCWEMDVHIVVFVQSGLANASIPTPEPVKQRKMFGAYGKAVGPQSYVFVNKVCIN